MIKCDKTALKRNEMTGETDVNFIDEYLDFHATRPNKQLTTNVEKKEPKIGIEEISIRSFNTESVILKTIEC